MVRDGESRLAAEFERQSGFEIYARLEDVVVVDLHTAVDSEDEATQCHAAGHPEEDLHRADFALLAVGERRSV